MVTKVSVFLCTRKILHGVNVFLDTAEYHVVSNRTDSWGKEGGIPGCHVCTNLQWCGSMTGDLVSSISLNY